MQEHFGGGKREKGGGGFRESITNSSCIQMTEVKDIYFHRKVFKGMAKYGFCFVICREKREKKKIC